MLDFWMICIVFDVRNVCKQAQKSKNIICKYSFKELLINTTSICDTLFSMGKCS